MGHLAEDIFMRIYNTHLHMQGSPPLLVSAHLQRYIASYILAAFYFVLRWGHARSIQYDGQRARFHSTGIISVYHVPHNSEHIQLHVAERKVLAEKAMKSTYFFYPFLFQTSLVSI